MVERVTAQKNLRAGIQQRKNVKRSALMGRNTASKKGEGRSE